MPSMMRRMRTRLPTYLSTGLGALVDIITDTPSTITAQKHEQTRELRYAVGGNIVKPSQHLMTIAVWTRNATNPDLLYQVFRFPKPKI
jgi:hypothetical protein